MARHLAAFLEGERMRSYAIADDRHEAIERARCDLPAGSDAALVVYHLTDEPWRHTPCKGKRC
jgi:hypothetical protein